MSGVEAMGDQDTSRDPVHVAVLAAIVIDVFGGEEPDALAGWVVDGTLGAGEHAAQILATFRGVRLLGIDQDPAILAHAHARLAPFGDRARIRRARISELGRVLDEEGIARPVGMLFDVGVSSLQLDTAERGFSFQADGPLDMRMDPSRDRTAADIVNRWDEGDLADLFFHEGGETRSRKLAAAIVEARRRVPFRRTLALAELCERVLGRGGAGGRTPKQHPATRCFQALRRAVNEEGEELYRALELAEDRLADGGRLVVISFHSGEDRQVKHFLAEGMRAGRWDVVTKKPRRADPNELATNRRSRSAVLRAAVRTRSTEDRTRTSAPGRVRAEHREGGR